MSVLRLRKHRSGSSLQPVLLKCPVVSSVSLILSEGNLGNHLSDDIYGGQYSVAANMGMPGNWLSSADCTLPSFTVLVLFLYP